MHIPASDLHVRTPGQDEIASAPCITFAQVRDLAKSLKVDLATQFKGEVPAEVFAHVAMPKYGATVMPYWPVIHWFVENTTRPCRCGCSTRLPLGQAFATPTCRTRLAIMKDRKPELYRRRRKNTLPA
jgi:hypothetical protein